MRYHRLGRTGLYVSEICLGTMTYGGKGFWEVIGKLGVDAVAGQLRTAIDAGVNFVDTANVYHEGESEAHRTSGRWIRSSSVRTVLPMAFILSKYSSLRDDYYAK